MKFRYKNIVTVIGNGFYRKQVGKVICYQRGKYSVLLNGTEKLVIDCYGHDLRRKVSKTKEV